jgi:hypothetical protein
MAYDSVRVAGEVEKLGIRVLRAVPETVIDDAAPQSHPTPHGHLLVGAEVG